MKSSKILVVGGGITGISASLDLADQGYHVYLVEKTPSIGGRMAQLDKTFPTLDCSICILAPKMVETARHPNIELLTYSEVETCEQVDEDRFKVRIRKKARYVDVNKCTGCGLCVEKCPSKEIPWEFEEGLVNRTAIYIPFPQAVPRKATIDAEHCIMLTRGKCGICAKVCQAGAIDYDMKDEFLDLEVASVILATGYDLIKPHQMKRYNYGVFKNVVTSIEYERMLSASGPTGGHLTRPSDRQKPLEIAFILCVGSRNLNIQPFCSKFCCMYTSKAAVITKEHEPDVNITIFYNDLRVIGKNQEEFLVRAKDEYGIQYFRGIPGDIQEDPATKDLIVRHANLDTGEVEEKRFGMVVLASAVTPKTGTEQLSDIFGIELSPIGFFKTENSADEIRTTRDGIFVAGCCQGPDDIANCVGKASAAAALAGKRGIPAGEPLVKKPKVTPIPVEPFDPPKIGVFVCHCGINIGGYVDVPEVVEYAKTLPNVVYATDNLYTCSEDSQVLIKEAILENHLNRVIVAACTPRTHEPLFRATLEEVGLNPYLFHFVSIRELDSWVHMQNQREATQKAKDLVRMGVANVSYLEPLSPIEGSVEPEALIIGGGISGMVAAEQIANQGFKVHLVEKQSTLGGVLNNLHLVNHDHLDPAALLEHYTSIVTSHPNVQVHLESEVQAVSGSIGSYEVAITN
ncbi:MAG: NAD(P)-binding protein, partial [Promethearchaeota archaeon]